jgi:homoserine kinase type II
MISAAQVLSHYPAPLHGPIVSLGNHGGFSGALLFRIEAPAGPFCLRGWPAFVEKEQLDFVHALLRRACDAGLDFVPRAMLTIHNQPYVRVGDRFWELMTWMPGTPMLRDRRGIGQVHLACAAIAHLHLVWAEPAREHTVCPGVLRRLDAARDWLPLLKTGWQPPANPGDPVAVWAAEAWQLLQRSLWEVPRILLPWKQRPVPIQPCVCDIWEEHVLFDGDRVTGIVDFGSARLDNVAVDVARLLGSLCPAASVAENAPSLLSRMGLHGYEQQRPLSDDERALARDLHRTGTVIAAANWLRRLYRDGEEFDQRDLVALRLKELVSRLA